jgi:surfeit locus 1 family protein
MGHLMRLVPFDDEGGMKRIIFFVLFGLGGVSILVSLGLWQMQRLAWKQDILGEISARVSDEPITMTEAFAMGSPKRYTAVGTQGSFGNGYLRILASRKNIGAVYRIVRPFEAVEMGRILVDTGWLPVATEVPLAPEWAIIDGNLDHPNESDSFTPAPDLEGNIWFARDVPAMADALNTSPIMIVARDTGKTNLGVTAWPVDTVNIPNDHLQYAITWFLLALIWGAMTAYFLLRSSRSPNET